MFLSTVLAAAIASVPNPATSARATVRIAHSVRITKDTWKQDRSARKREITVRENSRPVTVRVIEFE